MSKLVPMEEAARLLGISIDRLTEMRSSNQIFGYRDGPNWKFKISELERVADELGVTLGQENDNVLDDSLDPAGSSDFLVTDSAKDMLLDDLSSDSVLDSGEFKTEVERPRGSTANRDSEDDYSEMESVELMEDSSVELFKKRLGASGDFDPADLHNEPESVELELADSGLLSGESNKRKFRVDGDIVPSEENVFEDEDDLSFGTSSIRLASESSRKLLGDDESVLDDPAEGGASSSDTGKMLGDDLSLSEEDLFDDDIAISDSSSFEESLELSSDFTDSGDLVLEDSDSSTEVRLEESGINLSANDSGILLDDKASASGSDIYSLELPEDDDDLIVVESASDDEFNLTPLADPLEEDDSTGSQVIALEDSEIYADESSEAILGDEFIAEPAMLDDGFGGGLDDGFGAGLMPAGMSGMTGSVVPEAPYNVYQILSLSLVALLLLLGSMVGYGAVQNMWMPDDQVVNRSVLNFFLRVVGMN